MDQLYGQLAPDAALWLDFVTYRGQSLSSLSPRFAGSCCDVTDETLSLSGLKTRAYLLQPRLNFSQGLPEVYHFLRGCCRKVACLLQDGVS